MRCCAGSVKYRSNAAQHELDHTDQESVRNVSALLDLDHQVGIDDLADAPKLWIYRNIELSMYRMESVLHSIPRNSHIFYVGTERHVPTY